MTQDAVAEAVSAGGAVRGLSSAEVADRRARGLANVTAERPSRTIGQIFRANILTRFNALLGAMFVVILIVGPLQDASFGFILIFNSGIGIVQELRAKRVLERVAVVTAPSARVCRDGEVRTLPAEELVVDDLIELASGDGLLVDGVVLGSDGLEIDESLLTGESDPVRKSLGDRVFSGSFVVAGSGVMRATDVGADAYGARLAAEARRFTLVRSELRDGINRLLRIITWVLVPVAVLLAWSQFRSNRVLADAARGSVAGTVTMVPEGLVLLTSIAFALGAIRLARSKVVVRELPALEGLARVDVLCIDKTGTLTTGALSLDAVLPTGGATSADAHAALAALAAADPNPNPTMLALRAALADGPASSWPVVARSAFSSARKYSGVDFGPNGVWLLGAPEILLVDDAGASTSSAELEADLRQAVEAGRRTLVLARAERLPHDGADPGRRDAVALVVLRDVLRPDAASHLGLPCGTGCFGEGHLG